MDCEDQQKTEVILFKNKNLLKKKLVFFVPLKMNTCWHCQTINDENNNFKDFHCSSSQGKSRVKEQVGVHWDFVLQYIKCFSIEKKRKVNKWLSFLMLYQMKIIVVHHVHHRFMIQKLFRSIHNDYGTMFLNSLKVFIEKNNQEFNGLLTKMFDIILIEFLVFQWIIRLMKSVKWKNMFKCRLNLRSAVQGHLFLI